MKQNSITILFLFIASVTFSQTNDAFKLNCDTLPFESIKNHHPIDRECGNEGEPVKKNVEANKKQNAAKNNFCAKGNITDMKRLGFVALHKKVKEKDISYGSSVKVPKDRSDLETLGEGTLVRFTGYIIRAENSNVSDGESVNCNEGGAGFNDIHIDLIEKKNDTVQCHRVSAEMSPHYRPKNWNKGVLNQVKNASLKVRITGQLFFDASHTCCQDEVNGKKAGFEIPRASSWEVHPVYKIEVFSKHEWIDLDEYVQDDE
jgi:hypothetical protein